MGETFKELNEESIYLIDTFPIPSIDNSRARRSHLHQGKEFWGYQSSKKRYYYGLKLHLMVTKEGLPVEFFLTPASFSDTKGLELFDFDLPEGSEVYGDKAYNYYGIEDALAGAEIYLIPIRKKNSKRSLPPWRQYLQSLHRKAVETSGSLIERILPRSIHAVTSEGFEIKILLFLLASYLRH